MCTLVANLKSQLRKKEREARGDLVALPDATGRIWFVSKQRGYEQPVGLRAPLLSLATSRQ